MHLSRRDVLLGLTAVPFQNAIASEGNEDLTRVAVIDSPDNTAPYVASLKAANVKVVARYYSRRHQAFLPFKNMSSDSNRTRGAFEPALLADAGIATLSVYQYGSNSPAKFLTGLSDMGSAKKEAEADAAAALAQAARVKQPEGTAIYFGLDFNLTKFELDAGGRIVRDTDGRPRPNDQLIGAALDYFRTIGSLVAGHYAVGAYGNGFANSILRDEKLIEYSWVSASRAFEGTSDYISSGNWHIYQHGVDKRWPLHVGRCSRTLDVDFNIQNVRAGKIGVWGAKEVEPSRTKAVFDARRFALVRTPLFKTPGGQPISTRGGCAPEGASIAKSMTVRVIRTIGSWCEVDANEDGIADGFCEKRFLTPNYSTMPKWSN